MGLRVLVMGGTRFIGRAFASKALAAGHDLTLFHRGVNGCAFLEQAMHIHGDRDLSVELLRGTWDVTVDFSASVPGQVESLAAHLGSRAGTYVMISTTAAYAAPQPYGFVESQPLWTVPHDLGAVVDDDTYGPLKALCERAAHASFSRVLVLRPTYVIGPGDYTGRFAYWLNRIAAGGEVLAPGPADALFQAIDVRDLATWMVAAIERLPRGAIHIAAPFPPIAFGAVLDEVVQSVDSPDVSLVWVDRDFLIEQGCTGYDFPLWPGANADGIIEAADPSRARQLGFIPRSLAESIRDIYVNPSETDRQLSYRQPIAQVGLSSSAEADLLREWRRTR